MNLCVDEGFFIEHDDKYITCPVCSTIIEDTDSEYCPNCGALFDEEYTSEVVTQPWVLVYTTNTIIDAEMYKVNLESTGIPVQILSQADSVQKLTVGELAIIKIFVPSGLVSEALEIINEIRKST